MVLREKLTIICREALTSLGYEARFGIIQDSDRPDLGQFQCNAALAIGKSLKTNPREIAVKIQQVLSQRDCFESVTIAGPGFLNLTLKDEVLSRELSDLLQDPTLGVQVGQREKIVLDYGGPNVAKPMHVGHLRSAVIGQALKATGRFMGHDMIGDIHLGDWGLQMGQILAQLAHEHPRWPYFQPNAENQEPQSFPSDSPVTIDDLEQVYPAAKKHADDDASFMENARQFTGRLQQGHGGYTALWRHFVQVSVAELKRDYARLHVDFESWLGESDAQPFIEPLLERLKSQGLMQLSEGAWIVPVTEPQDAKPVPPLILIKSDGAVLYGTTDLATIVQRLQQWQPQRILYVVDNRQATHFKQVFRGAVKCAVVAADYPLEHIGFGTVNGKDGKPYKTREGGAFKLTDLLATAKQNALEKVKEIAGEEYDADELDAIAEDVSIAAIKFGDLINHRSKNYIFDLDRFVSFEGKTGPYIQYTIVRCGSILRKAAERDLAPGKLQPFSALEKTIYLILTRFPDTVLKTFEKRAPNLLAEYAYELCNEFNSLYHQHNFIREIDAAKRESWLALTEACALVLKQTMKLLAIPYPERM